MTTLPARLPGGRPKSATEQPAAEIVVIDTPTLGDRSYLVHDGKVALVIDPQRDIDRVLALAAQHGVRISHVFETHLHNDYVTGGLALALAVGVAYHVNAADAVAFDRVPVRDGEVIEVSPVMQIRVIATPGHTFTHLSYLLEAAGRPPAVFTGGSLLYGSTGRPDLMGAARSAELAHAQYASAHRLAADLPEDTGVYPAHGFGSFCSATQTGGVSSTIGRERRVNPVLTLDEQRYVAGLDAYPAYYAYMAPANAIIGPGGPATPPANRRPVTQSSKRSSGTGTMLPASAYASSRSLRRHPRPVRVVVKQATPGDVGWTQGRWAAYPSGGSGAMMSMVGK